MPPQSLLLLTSSPPSSSPPQKLKGEYSKNFRKAIKPDKHADDRGRRRSLQRCGPQHFGERFAILFQDAIPDVYKGFVRLLSEELEVIVEAEKGGGSVRIEGEVYASLRTPLNDRSLIKALVHAAERYPYNGNGFDVLLRQSSLGPITLSIGVSFHRRLSNSLHAWSDSLGIVICTPREIVFVSK